MWTQSPPASPGPYWWAAARHAPAHRVLVWRDYLGRCFATLVDSPKREPWRDDSPVGEVPGGWWAADGPPGWGLDTDAQEGE